MKILHKCFEEQKITIYGGFPILAELHDDIIYFNGSNWIAPKLSTKGYIQVRIPGIGRNITDSDVISGLQYLDKMKFTHSHTYTDVDNNNNIVSHPSLKYVYRLPNPTWSAGLLIQATGDGALALYYRNYERI